MEETMATLKDVAKLANVDISTVSRALNNTSYVHPDTKAKILDAVKTLSYRPNIIAQSLKQGKRHTIGVVIPRLSFSVFADITQGIEETAHKRGYETLICNTNDNINTEKDCLNRLRNGFIDGLIIAGTGGNNRIIRDLVSSDIPVTQIVRKQDLRISSITVNYENCGYEAVKYLAGKGAKNIGLINGSMKLMPYKDRYMGYKRALEELELEETTAEIPNINVNSFEYGYNCALKLIDSNSSLDAIMVAADIQGIGAMRAILENGLSIPNQIKLISLTGHSIGSMLWPAMTAMEMPGFEIGSQAATMNIDEIENLSKKDLPKHLTFSSTLIERESC
ncbi:transcriptional regulator, LacI family [Catonella morbi ATCC 51271]|uniref:Transcriptional regulator, LacI family n=2 Tax=Catonella TaxID=43996 RepID=V2XN07_9FIRM|nr:transcriptional regulator, LacI family [Catonella morbi ATCC 51271]